MDVEWLAVAGAEEWQLLKAVQPIFAHRSGYILDASDEGTLLNLETIFDFEVWLLPSTLREAFDCGLTEYPPQAGSQVLMTILHSFEKCVGEKALAFDVEGRFANRRFSKLWSLNSEVERRSGDDAEAVVEHCAHLSKLVWAGMTLDGFREMTTSLERFNGIISNISVGTYDEEFSQPANKWDKHEIQAVTGAEIGGQRATILSDGLCEMFCRSQKQHTVMIQLSDSPVKEIFLPFCANTAKWRKAICAVSLDDRQIDRNASKAGMPPLGALCGSMNSSRHKQLHITCCKSKSWYSHKDSATPFKAHPTITLNDLLRQRASHQAYMPAPPTLSKMRLKVLSVALAKSLLTLLGSRWLQYPWNSGRIFFIHDSTTNEIVDIYNPYIQCSFDAMSSVDSPSNGQQPYLLVFAFGLILLELELGHKIDITIEDEDEADEEYPAIYMALSRMFNTWKDDLDDPYIREVINACLDFDNKVESIKHPAFSEALKPRAALLRYIVQPLENRLRAAHPDISFDASDGPQQPVRARFQHTRSTSPGQSDSGAPSQISAPKQYPEYATSHQAAIAHQSAVHYQSRSNVSDNRTDQPQNRGGFEVVIICALPAEANAVQALFDKIWDDTGTTYGKEPGDRNSYTLGLIGQHNVVLAYMPGMGNNSAANVASDCRFSFRCIKLALVVGICGGVPFLTRGEEVILGDVVISEGLVPHDFGRQYPGQFVRKDDPLDRLARPNSELRSLLAKLKSEQNYQTLRNTTFQHLFSLQGSRGATAAYPGAHLDTLYDGSYRHKHHEPSGCMACSNLMLERDIVCTEATEMTCEELGCSRTNLVHRQRLQDMELQNQPTGANTPPPQIHFGLVASGNVVMKFGEERDRIARRENVIAFEMEGAGVWDNFPCLIIKGVCDYADSHKNKRWQGYAAATAAACAKAFLEHLASGRGVY